MDPEKCGWCCMGCGICTYDFSPHVGNICPYDDVRDCPVHNYNLTTDDKVRE